MADRQFRSKWQVHESTARAACRLSFMTLGLLPLTVCLVWSAQVFLPTYQRQQSIGWEELLSAQLGLQFKVAAVEALAPQRYALHGVRLLHAETGIEMGRVRRADVERSGGKWMIGLVDVELEGAQLAATWRTFHDWFLCRPRHAAHAAHVQLGELTIHEASGHHQLHDISLDLLPGREATLVSIQFHIDQSAQVTAGAAQPIPKLSQVIVKRHHRPSELKTELQLRTGATGLACSLLKSLSPLIGRLGDVAEFAGTIDLDISGANWRMVMTRGRLSGIDMAQLTADSEAAITGQAQMFFENLIVGHNGIEVAYGRGEILAGNMTQGLFRALGKNLGVVPLRAMNQVSTYGFDRCDFAIHLREPSLHLCCDLRDALGLLAARGEERWLEPLPLENIVAALQSCSTNIDAEDPNRLPATWLTKQALLWLPLGNEQVRAAKSHLRLSSNQNTEHQ